MAGISPLRVEDIPELETEIHFIRDRLGFVPNSLLTLARRPDILQAFTHLLRAVVGPGKLRPDLKQLVAYIASTAAGRRYCQAHTASTAARIGVSLAKLENAWMFEADGHFDEAERAALRLARDASVVPNATTPSHFVELRKLRRGSDHRNGRHDCAIWVAQSMERHDGYGTGVRAYGICFGAPDARGLESRETC